MLTPADLARLQQLHAQDVDAKWIYRFPIDDDDNPWLDRAHVETVICRGPRNEAEPICATNDDGAATVDELNRAKLLVLLLNGLSDMLPVLALGLRVQEMRERIEHCFIDSDWGREAAHSFSVHNGSKVLRDLLALLDPEKETPTT